MPAKKKQPVAAPATASAEPLANKEYNALVEHHVDVLLKKWPTLPQTDALPEVGGSGFKGLTGFGSPFNPAVYDEKMKGPDDLRYECHTNLLHQKVISQLMAHVPMDWDRVVQFSETLVTPVPLKDKITLLGDFATGGELPKGSLRRVSPCEKVHAVLLRVSRRITDKAPESELNQWLRVLLSAPTVFVKLATTDDVFGEAQSLRGDDASGAALTALSARQMCYNIYGFKARKELELSRSFGAGDISQFWDKFVRRSAANDTFTKKSSVDTSLTCYDRFFSVSVVEGIVIKHEKRYHADSFFNNLWKCQEIIYRCGKKHKIVWVVESIDDAIESCRLRPEDFTHASLKTGARSFTDVFLMCLQCKEYLLGEWLDSKNFPSYIKVKAREIFAGFASWRTIWHPLSNSDVKVDTTWIFKWPKVGQLLLDFLESTIFTPTVFEQHLCRQAVKNCSSPAELMQQKPWVDTITTITDQLRTLACPDAAAVAPSGQVPDAGDENTGGAENQAEPENAEDRQVLLLKSSQALLDGTTRLMKQQAAFLMEQVSFNSMKALFEDTPLSIVKASDESGNVLILWDCNTWGEADHRPDMRVCPIGKDRFDVMLRALIAARHGVENPDVLNHGELYLCVSGGKDRKRLFLKPIKNPAMTARKGKKDKSRLICRSSVLHISEKSWRARRKRARGQAKLTQALHLVATSQTFAKVPHVEFSTVGGSTGSDVVGPIDLDPLVDLPTMKPSLKKEYYGKRYVLAGGRLEGSSDDADENEEDDDDQEDHATPAAPVTAAKQDSVPVSYHALPIDVVLDFYKAYNVKHVIDLTPTPLGLAFEILALGGSYVGVCASDMQAARLKDQLFNKLILGIVDESQPLLYDARFSKEAADAGMHCNMWACPNTMTSTDFIIVLLNNF